MIEIQTLSEWENLKEQSKQAPVVLYIHSLSCPVSMAINHRLNGSSLKDTAYLIPVQTSPEVSEAIEVDLNIKHESPQVIIMKNSQAVYNADHWDINDTKVIKALSDISA